MLLQDCWHDPRSSTVLFLSFLHFCPHRILRWNLIEIKPSKYTVQFWNDGSKLYFSVKNKKNNEFTVANHIFFRAEKTFTNHSQGDYRQTCCMKKLILWNLFDKTKEAKRFQKHHIIWFTKRNPTAHWQLIREVTEQLKSTCKELQTSLASVKTCVQHSTIRKRLGNKNPYWRAGKTTAYPRTLRFAKKHLDETITLSRLMRRKRTFISGM